MKRSVSLVLSLLMMLAVTLSAFSSSAPESSIPQITGESSRVTEELKLEDGTETGVLWSNILLNGYYGDNREVNIVEFDLSNPRLSIEVFNSGKYIVDTKKLADAASAYDKTHKKQTVLAAVNGDLWMTNVHSGPTITSTVLKVTRGVLMIDGEIWASQQIDQENLDATNNEKNAPAGEKACFGVTYDNQPLVGSPDVQISISVNGETIKADGLNRLPANNAIIVYNHRVNSSNCALKDSFEVELEVESSSSFYAGKEIKAKVVNVYEPGSKSRPSLSKTKTIVLTGRGNRLSELADNFKVGDEVTLSTSLVDRWGNTELWQEVEDAIGGHMTVLHNGLPVLANGSNTAYPSALIGYKDDGTVMIASVTSTIDRSRDALRLYQSYEFCKELGYNSVFFLDGGGSCTFLTLEEGSYVIRNQCSDGSPRAVINGLAVVWNNDPVCEEQGSLDYIKAPIDISDIPPTYMDGALLYDLVNEPNFVNISYDVTERALCIKTTAETIDPYASLHFTRLSSAMAEDYPYIVMKIKNDHPTDTNFTLFYSCDTKNGASASRCKPFPVKTGMDEWQYVIMDMSDLKEWQGKINYLRLDVFDSTVTPKDTTMYIGAFVLCRSLEEAEMVKTGWTPEGAVTDYLEYLKSKAPAPEPTPNPAPNPEPTPNDPSDSTPTDTNTDLTWVWIAASIVAVIAFASVIYLIIRSKKKR